MKSLLLKEHIFIISIFDLCYSLYNGILMLIGKSIFELNYFEMLLVLVPYAGYLAFHKKEKDMGIPLFGIKRNLFRIVIFLIIVLFFSAVTFYFFNEIGEWGIMNDFLASLMAAFFFFLFNFMATEALFLFMLFFLWALSAWLLILIEKTPEK
ncbi:hypothetical protein ACSMFR_05865 [Listeria aquatica]|uniref:hypothetical protein n=1 Tax=Listeria aquatica TaxID=1494960 RepID=UPI003F71AD61